MPLTITFSNLELKQWLVVNDTTVNPVPVDADVPELVGGALEDFISASKPYAGALIHCPLGLPTIGGEFVTPYAMLTASVMIPDAAAQYMRCLEIDFKTALASASGTPIQNLAHCCMQIETWNGGNLQVDNAAQGWVDAGFKFGSLPVATWFRLMIQYKIDAAAMTSSLLSVSVGALNYPIPAALQNIPWATTTDWAAGVNPAIQLDTTDPAAFGVEFRGIKVNFSDVPL